MFVKFCKNKNKPNQNYIKFNGNFLRLNENFVKSNENFLRVIYKISPPRLAVAPVGAGVFYKFMFTAAPAIIHVPGCGRLPKSWYLVLNTLFASTYTLYLPAFQPRRASSKP